ncbi:response regulator [Methylocaldum gracile]|nr:response regulator [Methylocaldum sp. BRCS4]
MFRQKNFLVVDDNEINRILLTTQLSDLGAHVIEAGSGIKAVEKIRTHYFDLIFLDLRMPGVSGFDVIQAIRMDAEFFNRNTPIIAVTAHALPQQRKEILEAGFCDCLIKPILEDQLLRVIDTWLGVSAGPSPRTTLPSADSYDLYLNAIIEKTGGNRALAEKLMLRLAQELPEQLADVEKALCDDNYRQAREITHKINGSASFCGLFGIRKAASELETALVASPSRDTLREYLRAMECEIGAFLSKKMGLVGALNNS